MSKIKYLCVLLSLILFFPKVYAFSYDINMNVSNTSLKKGTVTEIEVSLENIEIDSKGIAACSMDISFDDNILLNSKIRTLNSWSMSSGLTYLFDTSEPAIDKSAMFIIPVKINGDGKVKLFNISCSTTDSIVKSVDKEISFSIIDDQNLVVGETNGEFTGDSNADLSDIILSEGKVDFDPAVTEYTIEVSNFEDLEITPIVGSESSNKNVVKDSKDKKIEITVNAKNGNEKRYTIYVDEVSGKDIKAGKSNNNSIYIPIFILIIVALVIVNVVRIIKNKKKV